MPIMVGYGKDMMSLASSLWTENLLRQLAACLATAHAFEWDRKKEHSTWQIADRRDGLGGHGWCKFLPPKHEMLRQVVSLLLCHVHLLPIECATATCRGHEQPCLSRPRLM